MSFIISKRNENSTRYDNNAIINLVIERMFKTSVKNFLKEHDVVSNSLTEDDKNRIWNSPECAKIPYSSSTLGESGCAIYTFHQGLRLQRGYDDISIESLADEISCKGYYEPGSGTYHNLFDHFGLRRASSVEEIFENVTTKKNPVITVLVRNKDYTLTNSVTGRHFINIVGSSEDFLLVDDPEKSQRHSITFKDLLPAIDIAWIW